MLDRRTPVRCAVYTRKSSEEGLEQEFNSLHAQREACEAYILSQRHEGWTVLPVLYDDGGISGGTMNRPALQRLLADIASGLVDCVVVYKVDRLTRSLTDFARIVDVLDRHGASFVSVTQAFNTTSSMGRLTLNVLLSFAQFEREVTGERIRDKIAASKKKGMWMGGWVPLGYDANERTLTVNATEAAIVRTIFQLYLDLGNVRLVQEELDRRGIVTKRHVSAGGKEAGGASFSRGHLYKLLANPLYTGRIAHKGTTHRGQHAAIIDGETWDAVQAQLKNNGHARRVGRNARVPSLLAGLLTDEHDERLIPVHANKEGRRYRYYAARPAGRSFGRRPGTAASTHGSVSASPGDNRPPAFRIAAAEIEPLVLRQLVAFLRDELRLVHWTEKNWRAEGEAEMSAEEMRQGLDRAATLAQALEAGSPSEQREALLSALRQVRIERHAVWITLNPAVLRPQNGTHQEAICMPSETGENRQIGEETSSTASGAADDILLHIPVSLARRGVETKLVLLDAQSARSPEPPDRALIKAVARAHGWWEELSSGRAASIGAIAAREGVTDRYVSQVIELAFLAPPVVEAILAGTQAAPLTAKTLTLGEDIPLLWNEQRRCLEEALAAA